MAKRVIFETGPISTLFYHALTLEGVPAICIEARHAQKIWNDTLTKTNANDTDDLAELANCALWNTATSAQNSDSQSIRR